MDLDKAERLCPHVEAAFGLLAKKWAGLIINALLDGELHFCDLEKAIPAVSARVLSLRVRELEQAGLVARSVSSGSPVRVTYRLTAKGRALEKPMRDIAAWAKTWEAAEIPRTATAGAGPRR